MNHPNLSVFQRSESQRSEVESQSQRNQGAHSNSPRFVACLLLLPEDSKSLPSSSHLVGNIPEPPDPRPPIQPPYQDSWLTHEEASKTTLYRYACQHVFESRKMGGRLQYRQSALDQFKDQHTRPARF